MSALTPQRVPFADLSLQWDAVKDAVVPDLMELFATSEFVLGPNVDRFERHFADFIGVRHAIGVNSGTSALHLAVLAAGLGPGDRVLVPSHTFVATAWAPSYAGAEPVFCDVDEATGNIDVADAERRISPAVKAIIPVHLYGQPADMHAVTALAEKYGLTVIEDCAQSHGATYDGRRAGTFGRFACFSFYPGKNLGAAGEAGAVCTNDDAAAARVRALRNHAQSERYVHTEIGYNYRMEGVQGLVLDHKLHHIDAWTAERKAIASRYLAELADLDLALPEIVAGDHVFHLFVIRTPRRDDLRAFLANRGIETGLHYPVPLHRQPCFAALTMDRTSFPVTDAFAARCLSLPIYVGMTAAQIDAVIAGVRDFMTS